MNLMGFNIEEFMSQFENGDEGWKDENDKRVQKAFNKLDTLVDRQKYDAFLDYQKRQDENYSTPKEEVQDLNAEMNKGEMLVTRKVRYSALRS